MEVLHCSAEGLQHLCGHECDLDRFEWEKRPSVNTSGVLLLDLCANHTLNTVLKDKGVHICMRHQDFVIIPSDLQLYVLDTWVKSSSPPGDDLVGAMGEQTYSEGGNVWLRPRDLQLLPCCCR